MLIHWSIFSTMEINKTSATNARRSHSNQVQILLVRVSREDESDVLEGGREGGRIDYC